MQTRTLRQIIDEKITHYISCDNGFQDDMGFFRQAAQFLKTGTGKAGKARAEDYQRILATMDDKDLFDEVYCDAVSGLESSTKLRMRLLEALCEFTRIRDDKINSDIVGHQKILAVAGGIAAPSNFDKQRISSMKRLLEEALTQQGRPIPSRAVPMPTL